MRGPFNLVIVRTGRDHYKLYVEGFANSAQGRAGDLPLRYAPVAAQPAQGFRSVEAAHDGFLDLLREDRRRDYEREEANARSKPGSPLPEGRVLRSSALLHRLRRRAPGATVGRP